MKSDQLEIRYMQRKSARSWLVWAAHAAVGDTPAAGPMIVMRLMGWTLTLYPWMHSKRRA